MSASRSWEGLVTAAILGTDRRPFVAGDLPGYLAGPAGRLTGDPATTLLGAVCLVIAWERAGTRPLADVAAPEPLPGEELRAMSSSAAQAFADAMKSTDQDLLLEAVALAAAAALAAPPPCLPDLLDRAVASTVIRQAVLGVLGRRGRWLAAQNPAWAVVAEAVVADLDARDVFARPGGADPGGLDPEVDPEGVDPDGIDPDGVGPRGVADRWAALPGARRLSSLRSLRATLGPADEELLERALDDRRADVRAEAAMLLADLPESAFVRRMTARADRLVAVKRRPLRTRISLVELERLDDDARRDGLEDHVRVVSGSRPPDPSRARAEAWGVEVLAITPLRIWDQRLGGPKAALEAVEPGDVRVFWSGWTRAAARQHDLEWIEALASNLGLDDLASLGREVRAPWPDRLTSTMMTRLRVELARVAEAGADQAAPPASVSAGRLREVSLISLVSLIGSRAVPTADLAEALLALTRPSSPSALSSRLEDALHAAHDLLALRLRLNREIS